MKLTITRIGKTAPAQFNSTRVGFQAQEYSNQWLSGFFKRVPNVGDVLEGDVAEVEKDGKKYLNFSFPKKFAVTEEDWIALEKRVEVLEKKLSGVSSGPVAEPDEIDSESLPW